MDLLKGDSKYESVSQLGSGSYGEVVLAKNRQSDEKIAIKFMPRGKEFVTKNVERELLAHSSFCHPHVVLFKEVFLTPSHLGIALEYAQGGDLYQYCASKGNLSEDESRRFLQQIVLAMDYVHKMGVVSRDIKLENTLLDKSKRLVKLTDFGFAKTDADSLPISNVGTPNYAAPEVISASRERYDGTRADIWSCGVVLYVMLFHAYPFERPSDPPGHLGFTKVMQRTLNADYRIPSKPKISEECKHFLSRLLEKSTSKRITVSEIYEHPWFKKGFPAAAKNLNEECVKRRPAATSSAKMQEDIKRIVQAAMNRPGEKISRPSSSFSDSLMDREISDAMAVL